MTEDAPHLDGEYAAFGKITKGMDTADKIVNSERDIFDKPLVDQTIKTIKIK